jgi:hypothetical protein
VLQHAFLCVAAGVDLVVSHGRFSVGRLSFGANYAPARSQQRQIINRVSLVMPTDLSVGLISVLTDIIWRFTVTWHAGNVACKLIRFSQVI